MHQRSDAALITAGEECVCAIKGYWADQVFSFTGHPYDGHALKEALEQVAILTYQRPDLAVVDGGQGETKTRVLISGTRRGLTPNLMADLRRRSAIEAEIGHMKTDVRLSQRSLKGTIGDALFAVL